MDISGFEAWLPQGQEAQQSQVHSSWMPGLFPLSSTSALQFHRGIFFKVPLCPLTCLACGSILHILPAGQEGPHQVQSRGFGNFGDHSEASVCRAPPELQAQGQEGALLSLHSQGKGSVLLPGTGEKLPEEPMSMECGAVALGRGAVHATGR